MLKLKERKQAHVTSWAENAETERGKHNVKINKKLKAWNPGARCPKTKGNYSPDWCKTCLLVCWLLLCLLSVYFLLSCWIGVLAGQAHVTSLHCRYCVGVACFFFPSNPIPEVSHYKWIVSSGCSAKAKAYTMRPGKKMLRYTFYLHSISMWSLLFPVCLLFFPPKPTNQPY